MNKSKNKIRETMNKRKRFTWLYSFVLIVATVSTFNALTVHNANAVAPELLELQVMSNDYGGLAIAAGTNGSVYIAGQVQSVSSTPVDSDFVATSGAFQTERRGVTDAFVAKMAADGTLEYLTFLGGSDEESALGIAVDDSGCAYVTGYTHSSDFPLHNPLSTDCGYNRGFVTKLNPSGSALIYSTCIGDVGWGIAIHTTNGTDYNAYIAADNVVKLAADGSAYEYLTPIIGGLTIVEDIAVDVAGNAYVVGTTYEKNFFTTPGAFQTTSPSGSGWPDAFVMKINSTGSIDYSTYLGGSSIEDGMGISVDGQQNAYVTGSTYSENFPKTPGAYQTTLLPNRPGGSTAFVTKLNSTGSNLVYSTYLGEIGSGHSINVDTAGNALVLSRDGSTIFPPRDVWHRDQSVSFVTKLNTAGSALEYVDYTEPADDIDVVSVGDNQEVYVTGQWLSSPFVKKLFKGT